MLDSDQSGTPDRPAPEPAYRLTGSRRFPSSRTRRCEALFAAVEDVGAAWDDTIHRCLAGRTLLLPELPVGEFGDDVEVSEVASVFLDQMEQDAFERRRVGTVPAGAWFAHLGQIVGLDDGSAALGLYPKGGHEVVERLLFCEIPTVAAVVAPRIGDRTALKTPFEPPQLDIRQMLEQLDR